MKIIWNYSMQYSVSLTSVWGLLPFQCLEMESIGFLIQNIADQNCPLSGIPSMFLLFLPEDTLETVIGNMDVVAFTQLWVSF